MNGMCAKCGEAKELVHHHVKYEPEEIIMVCRSCHTKIHYRVRKEGLCPYTIEETRKLSAKSACKRHYEKNKEESNEKTTAYNRENLQQRNFYSSVGLGWSAVEQIICNKKTGTVTVTVYFKGRKMKAAGDNKQ
jgi:hypothetical protein